MSGAGPTGATAASLDVTGLVGSHDVVLLVLDSLRFDVASRALTEGLTPVLAALLPDGWQRRHTPGTFTLPAHQAFLAGFLPTPVHPQTGRPVPHHRLFAGRFDRARGIGPGTFVFDEPDLPAALAARGYRTICSGGVGFFTGRGVGALLPSRFQVAHWSRRTGVHARDAAAAQFAQLAATLGATTGRAFVLCNVAATHTPTHGYLPGARADSIDTQAAALADVDTHLPVLLDALGRRGPALLVVFSDHGTCFGDDGLRGHGFPHPVVMTVPYAEVLLPGPAR